jgi:DeoR/GlpR family transcriptional regulator of sugar metabolism
MMTAERKAKVLEIVASEGAVVAKDLAAAWGVSEDTIRRDLRELAAAGHVQRVHGGALPVSPAAQDFSARLSIAGAAKTAVGRRAAGMIENGQTVFVDGGTTAQALCRALPTTLRATVLTHSPTIAMELVEHAGIDVLLIGGRIFRHSVVAVGAIAAEQIASLTADIFFMGVTGVHPTAGLTTGDAEEAAIKRAICHRSAETYVLATSEKIGTASPFVVVDFAKVTGAITDAKGPVAMLRSIARAGLPLIAAM